MRILKKLLPFIIVLFVFTSAHAVDWKVTNQVTIAWDAVTILDDGTPIPPETPIKYRVYMANANTDPNKANPVVLGDTDLLEYTLTLNTEGKFYVGVSAVRFDDAGVEVEESTINWSDVNGEMTPNPFGLVHYIRPAIPKNLR